MEIIGPVSAPRRVTNTHTCNQLEQLKETDHKEELDFN
jgi:hypothetical protein